MAIVVFFLIVFLTTMELVGTEEHVRLNQALDTHTLFFFIYFCSRTVSLLVFGLFFFFGGTS